MSSCLCIYVYIYIYVYVCVHAPIKDIEVTNVDVCTFQAGFGEVVMPVEDCDCLSSCFGKVASSWPETSIACTLRSGPAMLEDFWR